MDICFANSNFGWVVGFETKDFWYFGYLAYSSDGGVSWTRAELPTSNMLSEVVCIDDERCWICGASGTILYTENNGGITSIAEAPSPAIPAELSLSVYPNPFNSSTTIEMKLTQPGTVLMNIIDLAGRTVVTRRYFYQSAGTQYVDLQGNGLATGIYIVTLTSADQTVSRKIALVK